LISAAAPAAASEAKRIDEAVALGDAEDHRAEKAVAGADGALGLDQQW
jgi:hypothetical protein